MKANIAKGLKKSSAEDSQPPNKCLSEHIRRGVVHGYRVHEGGWAKRIIDRECASNARPMHIVMLVNNSCVNDSRVIKSAEALVESGHNVTVICRQYKDLPKREVHNGVTYCRVAPVPLDWIRLKTRMRSLIFAADEMTETADAPGWTGQDQQDPLGVTTEPSSFSLQSRTVRKMFDMAAGTLQIGAKKLRRRMVINISMLRSMQLKMKRHIKLSLSGIKRTIKINMSMLRRIKRTLKGRIKRGLGSIKRKLRRLAKRLITSLYWFAEADEFGIAAQREIAGLSPDAIHAHDLTTLPAAGKCASIVGARLVYDSHELEMHRNSRYPWLVRLRRRLLERKYIRRADAVITVSNSIADHLCSDYGISRPTVVMNAPLFDATATPISTVRRDIGLGPNDKLCVYVGSVTINRGLDLVVRALVTMPDVHFATVGPRRAATEHELTELAIDFGVRDRLYFMNPVAPAEVVGYIGSADVSVLPIQNVCLSYYYCMPNKLLESVFAGVPVAVANLLEMRRFVEENRCGVIMDETEPEAIAQAISHVITCRDQYILSWERRAALAERYGWTTQAGHLQSLYSSFSATMDREALSNRSG